MPFCPKCGNEVPEDALFCPSCGHNLKQAPSPEPATLPLIERKNAGVAAVLALVLGLFGLMGIGHVYVGRVGRGILLLIVGIILGVLTWGSFLVGFVTLGIGFIGTIFFGIILIILWIWQTYDAYSLAKKFNRVIQETGKEPW